MKTADILFSINLLGALYTGYIESKQQKIMETNGPQQLKIRQRAVPWKPYIGICMIVIGGAIFILSQKKSINK